MPFDGKVSAPITTAMRNLLGPNGENWCKRSQRDLDGKHCLVGAYGFSVGNRPVYGLDVIPEPIAKAAKKLAIRETYPDKATVWHSIAAFNNDAESFDDIKRFLDTMEEFEVADAGELVAA